MIHQLLLQVPATATTLTATVVDTAKAAAQVAAAQPDKMSLLDLIWKGGVIMIPLGILSLITVFVIIERYLFIKKASRSGKNFMNSMRDVMKSNNLEAA
ncbi:MAG TPA: MotA/TolQ/ExbB proton channel family protein, partial [Bacteroidia bacterium]|nr:MotA/TolQ/ExbB proton channel family protein [Bacteroidia bacterium]